MPQSFLSCDRDQVLLLPPDLQEWLAEDHLAWFVIAAVDELDLSAVYAYYRWDGRGRPAHDPAMMVALVLYAYAIGVTSSREIERRCVDDVAFRVISANRRPDHATIARFLIRHRDAISGLFCEVLGLCARAGMVRVGMVAVDSTKLAANASCGQNRTLDGLRKEAERIIGEAIDTDRREDELYGEARGDELPAELADPRTRAGRIRQLLEQARAEQAQIEAEREAKLEREQEHLARTGKRRPGRPTRSTLSKQDRHRLSRQYNVTDPDSGLVRERSGRMLQGYSTQTVVSDDQVILAVVPSQRSSDQGQLAASLQRARENLTAAGVSDPFGDVLGDSGYWSIRQIQELEASAAVRVLIPPINIASRPEREHPFTGQMRQRLQTDEGQQVYGQRQRIVEPVFGQIKHNRKITRLLRRGKQAVQAEITLIATTHNLLKLRSALQTV
jgi:transposase